MNLRAIALALGGTVAGGQVLAPGPGHSPRDRSLSVKPSPEAPDGFMVHSHAGDDWRACRDHVYSRLSIVRETSPSQQPATKKSRIAALYDYQDENCELLFQVARLEPKSFRQCRPDGNGGRVWNMDGIRRIPYHLPELLDGIARGETIFIAEGEKAVDELMRLGMWATCSPGGAGKWRDDYATHFRGANVVVLPDNDEVGEKHAEDVVRSLSGVAASVRILRLSVPEKGDVYDWIASGGTASDLETLIGEAPQAKKPSHGLVSCCAADVEPESVSWAWEGRLAKGKHMAIAGEPGLGKSQIGIYIAATFTKGGKWPNDEGQAPEGRVIILSAEDDPADTIVPRLMAAGADRNMVEIIQAVEQGGRRAFNLQTDLHLLETKINDHGDVQLILIDPISAYFGKGIDSHRDVDVRSVLAPISEMANRLNVSILTMAHFNKGSSPHNTKALHKFMGSIAFVAAPRIAFAVIEDAEDSSRRLFLHAKNNLAAPPPGLAFKIEQLVLPNGIATSRVAWEADPVNITADEAVAARRGKEVAPALDEAKQFLAGLMPPSGMGVKEIEKEAKEAGLAWGTVRRAKEELGYQSMKSGMSDGWIWKK
jgi:putative DNA primase/helicase